MFRAILQRFLNQQIACSHAFDELLPADIRIDANVYFRDYYIGGLISSNSCVYDIGGGRHPAVTLDQKVRQKLYIVGLDLSSDQLRAAPDGIYDKTIAADITKFQGGEDADFIVSQALLEHVTDTDGAFKAFRSILKPRGIALINVPCRNAIFARLNLLLPEAFKRSILFAVYPATRDRQGWTAHYDRCTPAGFRHLATTNGFEILDLKPFYYSGYFAFCLPLYALWRVWVLGFRAVRHEQAAETFCFCIRKR